MRSSLVGRLLALSLLVALGAVGATAILATYSTRERLQGEIETSESLLEADQQIFSELTGYATDQTSWDQVGGVVRDASARTGRRVALTTPDGDMIADSAGPGAADLPSLPAATIDATSQGAMLAVPLSMAKTAEVHTARSGGGGVMVSSAGTPVGSPYWRLTDEERDRRTALANAAVDCLRRSGVPALTVPGPDGVATLTVESETKTNAPGAAAKFSVSYDDLSSHPCVPAELYAPSALAERVNTDQVQRATECLSRSGIDFQLVSGKAEALPAVLPAGDSPAGQQCLTSARTEALKPYVAPAAKLYLGSADRFDVFTLPGLLRTAATALGVLLIAALVTIVAGRRLLRPIHALTSAAQRMTAGDRAARVPVSGTDEVSRLGHAFNAMAHSIERNDHQRRVMVSDVAHELRTPLSNIKGYLEASEDGIVPLDRALVGSLLEETALLERLVSDLQELALADAGMLRLHPEQRDLTELAAQTVAAHTASADAAGITLGLSADSPVVTTVDPARIRQALGNLVANAVKFTPAGGSVGVSVRRDNGWIELAVADNGPGIAAEHLPHLFNRFYRADPSRSRSTGGSGLGLAITKHLAEAHGGTVAVTSTVGTGSTFVIRLPTA
jgi:two-component system sensor histidine kinase BaeS